MRDQDEAGDVMNGGRRRGGLIRWAPFQVMAAAIAFPTATMAQAVQTSPSPPPADLQQQVQNLTALVQSLSQQVQSLQAQLDARGAAP